MSNVGFKGFAKPKALDTETATAQAQNVSGDEFIIWTGNNYGRRRASGRSACLNTVTEKMSPVPLSDYVKRCQKLADGKGFDTSISVGGLSLHQVAKPTVYFYAIKDEKGNLVAKKDVPNPDPALFEKPIKAGDIILAANASKAVARKSTKKAAAKKA